MAARGSIRVRCAVCRKAGVKDGYAIDNPLVCKHPERVFNPIYPLPNNKQITATYRPHNDKDKPPAREQARLWLCEMAIKYNKNPQFEKPKEVLAEVYIEKYLERLKDSGDMDITSWTCYEATVRIHILPTLQGHYMNAITKEMIDSIKAKVKDSGPSLRGKINWHLKSIFRDAGYEKLIVDDPTARLKTKRKSSSTKAYQILNSPQINDLVNQAKNMLVVIYFLLPVYAGLRASEVAGLRVDDLDFEKNKIRVRQKIRYYNNGKERLYKKNKKKWFAGEGPDGLKSPAAFRTIPMSRELKKALEIFLIERKENKYGLLLATAAGEPIHQNTMKHHFNRAKKNCGAPTITYHGLRHTFCSILIKEGLGKGIVDLKKIQKWMGHDEKDMKVTWGIYTQIIDDNRDDSDVMESFDRFVDLKMPSFGANPVSMACQSTNAKERKIEQSTANIEI